MKLTEKILALIIITSLFLKYFHVASGNVLLIFSALGLSLLYFPLGFAFLNGIRFRDLFKIPSYANFNTQQMLGMGFLGYVFSTQLVAFIFKMNRYPMADFINMMALASIVIATILLIVFYLKTHSKILKQNLVRAVIFTLLTFGLSFMTPLTQVQFFYHDWPEYVETYENYYNNPHDFEAFRAWRILRYQQNYDSISYERNKERIERELKTTFEDYEKNRK